MKVCYLGRRSRRSNSLPEGTDDVLELLWDIWDDYGYETSFPISCRIAGERVDLGVLRLLVVEERTSYKALDQLRTSGWDGTFPAPGIDYVSVPSDITFYQQLKARLGIETAVTVATALRDASLLVKIRLDAQATELAASEGFVNSLQRERGSIAAYLDGWKVLENQAIAANNFQFRFRNVFDEESTLALNFASESLLPHDVNVLIGPNGAGKSQLLHQMVETWITPETDETDERDSGFSEQPNLSQVVVVSYSPFERFPVDMVGLKVRDRDVYRYFGFRGRSKETAEGKPGRIRLSHEFPRTHAAQSLIGCVSDDQRFKAITDWSMKVSTMESVLGEAFEFDFAAVEIDPQKRVRNLYFNYDAVEDGSAVVNFEGRRYIPVSTETMNDLVVDKLSDACLVKSGVTFFKENTPIELSSGQRLFAYIVINLLGVIRRNSLVLIDEPELFLHPTLEIQFVEMLKEILSRFNSKALLATHSEVIVREVPADCVHVFQRTDDGLVISNPPFQTFGGDIQRISSYVFGDNGVSKPFEKWLSRKVDELGSADALIEAMGDDLNEELIVQIKAMKGHRQW
ncbi:ATP-binding protein [Burkholderia contaminans]|uniref:ATP-binding protein n=1 Tax=Burkholderia contaminans TaxID=488447 RepID=A0A3N8PT78_9BURK|nr:ATP-binding protein [Burkholderia contaminans]